MATLFVLLVAALIALIAWNIAVMMRSDRERRMDRSGRTRGDRSGLCGGGFHTDGGGSDGSGYDSGGGDFGGGDFGGAAAMAGVEASKQPHWRLRPRTEPARRQPRRSVGLPTVHQSISDRS